MEPFIYCENVTYTYPEAHAPALADVTLEIERGEFVLFMGPSGSGKSTMLRCFNGLVPHFTGGAIQGHVRVAGADPLRAGPQELSRIVGFVFQDPEAQFVMDRVEDEIAFGLENAAVPPEEMRHRVEALLAQMGLSALRDRPLETLSGGERQRVAIAAALVLRPQVLALDEPTSQLDPHSAQEVLQAVVRLNREDGLTVLLAEHRLERILPYVDRIVYLPGPGRPVVSGPPCDVLRFVDIELTPPLVTLGKALGWEPLPLTLAEGRRFARRVIPSPLPRHASRPPSRRTPPVLWVEDLSVSYRETPVLRAASLSVGSGELVALMGRNGAGKTTLLRAIVGLLPPHARQGRIWLNGERLDDWHTAEICRRVGYLPQEPDALLFADTVADELWVTLRNHGLASNPPISPPELLDRLGLRAQATAYPRDLSIGQRQRVALGAVTVTRPRLLLLDEPTRGLDYPAKRALGHLLRAWQREGSGVLLVTHDVELVAQIADRVVLLEGGRVLADGPPDAVLTSADIGPFAPQVAQVFPGSGWLTAEDVLRGVEKGK